MYGAGCTYQATQQFHEAIGKYLQSWKNMKIQHVGAKEQKNVCCLCKFQQA